MPSFRDPTFSTIALVTYSCGHTHDVITHDRIAPSAARSAAPARQGPALRSRTQLVERTVCVVTALPRLENESAKPTDSVAARTSSGLSTRQGSVCESDCGADLKVEGWSPARSMWSQVISQINFYRHNFFQVNDMNSSIRAKPPLVTNTMCIVCNLCNSFVTPW